SAFSYDFFIFSSKSPSPSPLYTLSLHDALPIFLLPLWNQIYGVQPARCAVDLRLVRVGHRRLPVRVRADHAGGIVLVPDDHDGRSEEHTSELQSRSDIVCRLLLEKKMRIW